MLHERYELQRELGRGGMATVFLARDVRNQRDVAVKVLHPDLAMALGEERFRREIQIATRLTHPHILPLYDSGEADGQLFYVMPFVDGESLRQRLDRERQLGVDEAIRIAIEVAGALDYAHRFGVVHRDIKPENILLEDGHAIVADFGIARAISSVGEEKLTKTGVTLGTPTYMSPEQAMAERDIDGRSDVYALGCVLYEMLAGSPPFTGPTAQAIIARHTLAEVPSITVVRGTVPPEIEDAILIALAKVPADRFATAGEFAAVLQSPSGTTRTRRIAARTGGRAGPRTWSRRAIASAAAIAVLVAGGAGWALLSAARVPAPSTLTDANRLAVLYFEDETRDSTLAFVSDALTESLIDALTPVQGLDVVSRNGVLPYRDGATPPDSVARALGVGTLVGGAVEKEGDGVRVTVKLMDASGARLESASFIEPSGDPLAARDSLTQRVAIFLRQRLGDEVQLRATRAGTTSNDAWTLLQRAEQSRRRGESAQRAGNLTQATAALLEADSLLAAAAIADPAWSQPAARRAHIAYRRARLEEDDRRTVARLVTEGIAHADGALALDPRDGDALEARGTLRFFSIQAGLAHDDRDVARLRELAERDLQAAVTHHPGRAGAWYVLSVLNYAKPNVVEANLAARRAYEADAYLTNAAGILWRLYVTSYDMEQFPDAARWCEEGGRRFADDPRFAGCRLWLMTTKAVTPDPAEAWRLANELKRLSPPTERAFKDHEGRIVVAAVLARAGLADSARHVLAAARAGPDVDPRGELMGFQAFAHVLLGEKDEAIGMLQRYLTTFPDHRAGFGKTNMWWWRPLQDDPRFRALTSS